MRIGKRSYRGSIDRADVDYHAVPFVPQEIEESDALITSRPITERLLAALICFAITFGGAAYGEQKLSLDQFEGSIEPLLRKHCFRCHGGETTEAAVDFTEMTSPSRILGEADLWRRAREALQYEAMPPHPAESGFTPKQRELLARWIEEAVENADLSSPKFRHPGPSMIRQLTPYEYMRTVKDLLYLEEVPFGRLGVEQEYPQEGLEYVNQALGMTLSTSQFDRYLRTGEQVLKQLFGDEAGTWRKTGTAHRRYRKAAEKARPQVLFVQPGIGDDDGSELTEKDAAKRVLQRLASRAFRRPLRKGELDDLMSLFSRSRELGGSYEESLQSAMVAILASPHFLLRIEENRGPSDSLEVYPVTAHELATRLSYFLWSSMPDEQLREKADRDTLLDEAVLEQEVQRMLHDPKAQSLTDHFARQWLQLRLMELPSIPNRKGFPKLTRDVEAAFEREMRTFFDRMRTEDNSILDFLDSDYTYVDKALADFYGLGDAYQESAGTKSEKGDESEMVRVSLKPQAHRGGLLGMGGFLWMTSHESRTKPTARGKWILEVILGTPPPPPPPEAGSFAPPKQGQPEPKNFREKLEQHASDAACIGCHKKIDPLGFALENFDAIGNWREDVAGDPVDNAGRLPSGESFRGFEELRGVIKQRKARFVRNFVSQMLRYALGRELIYSDRGTIEQIAERVEENGYHFSEVVKGIATSRAFRHRVNLRPNNSAGVAEGSQDQVNRAKSEANDS